MKPEPKKVQEIMDIRQPPTTTEVLALIGMVQYYTYMCPRRSYVLAPLTEASSGPKGRKILWNDALEIYFKKIKRMVSAETLLNYPDWKIPFTVHTYASDKQLGSVVDFFKEYIEQLRIIFGRLRATGLKCNGPTDTTP